MNAGNKTYTDRTWIYEVDPASHSGETDRVEMKDITSEFDAPLKADQFLNFMLANACGVNCVDPENEGYQQFDLESNEFAHRFIARLDHIDMIKGKFYYEIKAVYVV